MEINNMAKTFIRINSHEDYIRIITSLRNKTKYIQIVQINGDERKKDSIIENAFKYMKLIKKIKTNLWAGNKTSSGNSGVLYEFESTENYLIHLKSYQSFFLSSFVNESYEPVYTDFGLDDICFLNGKRQVIFYTTTHEGLAFYDKKLIELDK